MTNAQQLWDTINEGGEGYRPAYAMRSARPAAKVVAPAGRMLRDARGNYIPESKVIARIAADEAKLPTLTNASAIAIVTASIAADRALLAG